ncbi:MAG TPA: OsmC family protein [Thermoanaerobaculia bacterium]|nr:OsmC family protein [Thermoanaerobaculia bacterium]
MTKEHIPSGKNTHAPQADGSPASAAALSAPEEIPQFSVSIDWVGDGSGCGFANVTQDSFAIPIGGAKELGGCGKGANPEELLLAAVGSCFAATWGIFLKKLAVPYPEPSLRLTGALGKDPAGRLRMAYVTIHARVPASLLASQRALIEKTLALSEKYCIISKVAKAAMPLNVVVEEMPG